MNTFPLMQVLTGMRVTGVVLLHKNSGDLAIGWPTRLSTSITLRGKVKNIISWKLESLAKYTAPTQSVNHLAPYGFEILGPFENYKGNL